MRTACPPRPLDKVGRVWGLGRLRGLGWGGMGGRYIALSSVLEGYVILRQNPEYVDDHLG